jgi:hypothetical protein
MLVQGLALCFAGTAIVTTVRQICFVTDAASRSG